MRSNNGGISNTVITETLVCRTWRFLNNNLSSNGKTIKEKELTLLLRRFIDLRALSVKASEASTLQRSSHIAATLDTGLFAIAAAAAESGNGVLLAIAGLTDAGVFAGALTWLTKGVPSGKKK